METNFTTFWNLSQVCVSALHACGWLEERATGLTGGLGGRWAPLSYPSSTPNQSQNVKIQVSNGFWIQSESLPQLHLPLQQLLSYFRLRSKDQYNILNFASFFFFVFTKLKILLSGLVIKRLYTPSQVNKMTPKLLASCSLHSQLFSLLPST